MKKILLLPLLGVVSLLYSCTVQEFSQENDIVDNVSSSKSLLIKEKGDLNDIMSWSEEKRIAFETDNGYKSFATKSEEVYFSLDFENVNSEAELYKMMEENSDYIEIVIDEFGEKELLPKYYRENKRYYLDENLKIPDVFKEINTKHIPDYEKNDPVAADKKTDVFNGGVYFSNTMDITESDYYKASPWTRVCSYFYYPCDQTKHESFQKTSGRDRTVAEYCFERRTNGFYNTIYWYFYCTNQKRLLGLWVLAKENHTIDMSFDVKIWNITSGSLGYGCTNGGTTAQGIPQKHYLRGTFSGKAKSYNMGPVHEPVNPFINDNLFISEYSFYLYSAAVGVVVDKQCDSKFYLMQVSSSDGLPHIVQTFE